MNKIFCIGSNKTGTTSLHKAFKILGLRSIHFGFELETPARLMESGRIIASTLKQYYKKHEPLLNCIEGLEAFDCYSDIGPIPIPSSK